MTSMYLHAIQNSGISRWKDRKHEKEENAVFTCITHSGY